MIQILGISESWSLFERFVLNSTSFQSHKKKLPFALILQGTVASDVNFSGVLYLGNQQNSWKSLLALEGWEQVGLTRFRSQLIYSFQQKGQECVVGFYKGYLIWGQESYQIEEIIVQLQEGEESVGKAIQFSDNQADGFCYLYLNSNFLPAFLKAGIRPSYQSSLGRLSHHFNWLRVAISWENGTISWEGSFDEASSPIVPNNKKGVESRMLQKSAGSLPANTAFLYGHWLSGSPAFALPKNTPFREHILPIVEQEMLWGYLNMDNQIHQFAPMLVLEVAEQAIAWEALQDFADASGLLEEYQYQTFLVKQILTEDLAKELDMKILAALQNPHCTVIDNYIVFTTSKAALTSWIDQYIVGKTLDRQTSFLQYNQENKPPQHSFYYFNFRELSALQQCWISRQGIYQNWLTALSGFESVGFSKDGPSTFRAKWTQTAPTSKVINSSNIAWRAVLRQAALGSPHVVQNQKGEYLILEQDESYVLYAFDQQGILQWTYPAAEPILSPIQWIHYYDKETQQLVFNTQSSLHLLNKDGEPQIDFPVPLPIPTNQSMLVVDFEQNNAYSFFLAGANGQPYALNQFAEILPGWDTLSSIGTIPQPLQHFQYDYKDFLVALNAEGSFYVYQRDGSPRFPTVQSLSPKIPTFSYQASSRSCRIVGVDVQGKVIAIRPNGSYFQLDLLPKEPLQAFVFEDLTNDGLKDYISMGSNYLSCHAYEGELFQQRWEYPLDVSPTSLFLPKGKSQTLGLWSQPSQQIFLWNKDGQLHPDFPLAGSSPFELIPIEGTTGYLVVVAFEDQVYAYKVMLNAE